MKTVALVCLLILTVAGANTALAEAPIDFKDILFIKRQFLTGGGNHMCDQYFGFHAVQGGGVFILENAFSDKPVVRDVLKDSLCKNGRFKGRKLPSGSYLSPDLSYDGKTILFAFTEAEKTRYRWTEKSTFHIFKVGVDGSELTQLTDGKRNDFDPCWMPNGRILFNSERRGGFGRCHARPVPTYTLHTMNPDGSDIVCISYHETNEWHPSIDNNGMIVYTRWDYIDRGFNQAHHPWITSPDGRDPRSIHGNFKNQQGDNPVMELDVRAIPGSRRYVATAAAHHGQAYGSLIMIDPQVEDDNKMAPITVLTPDAKFPESNTGSGNDLKYATAWPLSERYHLCVYDEKGAARRGAKNNYGICLLDTKTHEKKLLYRDPAISCLSPIPLRPRKKPPLVPHMTAVGKPLAPGKTFNPDAYKNVPTTGTVGVMNVYDSTLPFPKGTKIKYLRIIHILPKSTPHHHRPQISYGVEKFARSVLGTVPVEADGSALFTMPAGRSVFFQALDENMEAVQSMRSATYVHPGEKLFCNGCHEPRKKTASMVANPKALRRKPSVITPDVDGSNPFSFPRLVQPVLEKKCVPCHVKKLEDPKTKKKPPDLRKGDYLKDRRHWYTSYINLRTYAFYYGPLGGYDRWQGAITVPGKFGAKASKLYAMLKKGHNDVKLSKPEMHRITLWLECNSDFFGAYQNTKAQAEGKIVTPALN